MPYGWHFRGEDVYIVSPVIADQILTQNYSKAGKILDSIKNPDATTYYLKAILGARTNNQSMVATNLAQAVKLDSSMAQKALTDLEFANFNIADILR